MTTPARFHSTADFQLRAANKDDALCLSVLAMQVFLDTYATEGIRPAIAREVLSSYSERSFAEAIASSVSHIEIAELNGHLIGFAQLTFCAAHESAPPGVQTELLRLYVQEPFTGAMVGTRLLAKVEQIASAQGATVLWLTPWVRNHRAIAFYGRRGYKDHGLTYFILEGESHENRVFAKAIHPSAA